MNKISIQSFQYATITGIGFAISVLASLFIYPLNFELYGKFQFVLATSHLLIPLFSFGIAFASIKYFSLFRDNNKLEELFGSGLIAILIICGIHLILSPLLEPVFKQIITLAGLQEALFSQFYTTIILITIALTLTQFFNLFVSNYKKITIPGIISELTIKLMIPVLMIFSIFLLKPEKLLFQVLIAVYVLITLASFFYSVSISKLKPTFPGKLFRKISLEFTKFSFYSMLNSVAYFIVYRIDIIMVSLILGPLEAGYYSFIVFISSIIEIPAKGIINISGPVVANDMNKNDYQSVNTLYKKTSSFLMLICGIIGLVIYGGIEGVLALIQNGEQIEPYILGLLFLLIGRWINQSLSLNSHIINYSSYYSFNIFIISFQALLNIILNIILIKQYGLIGAALATMISVILNNVLKLALIAIKSSLWPFSIHNIQIFSFLVIFLIVLIIVPNTNIILLDLFLRTVLLGSLMIFLAYKLNLSKDLNSFIVKLPQYFKGKIIKQKSEPQ